MAGNKAFQLFLEVLKKYAQEVQFGILLEEQELLQRLMDHSYRYQELALPTDRMGFSLQLQILYLEVQLVVLQYPLVFEQGDS